MKIALLFMIIILSASVSAFSFGSSHSEQDVDSLKWCFKPFDKDTMTSPSYWTPYVDKVKGCQDASIDITITVMADYATSVDKCDEEACENVKNQNNTETKVCHTTCRETTVWKKRPETYSLLKTSQEVKAGSEVCIMAKRKPSTGLQSCDINFKYDNIEAFAGGTAQERIAVDSKDYGFLWWNISFNNKHQVNFTSTGLPQNPVNLSFNSSQLDFTKIQDDCGDIRIINSDENATIEYNVSVCNATTISMYVNLTSNQTRTIYIYSNASSTLNTTGIYFPQVTAKSKLYADYELSTNVTDTLKVFNGTQNGVFVNASDQNGNSSQSEEFTPNNNFQVLSLSTPSQFTYEFSLAVYSNPSQTFIMTNRNAGSDLNVYIALYTNGSIGCSVYNQSTSVTVYTSFNYIQGAVFNQFVCSYDGSAVKIYTNGTLERQAELLGGLKAIAGQEQQFGYNNRNPGNQPITANFSHIRLYSQALTDQEVSGLYTGGLGSSRRNMTYYPFYASPSFNVSEAIMNVILTEIVMGITNSSGAIIQNGSVGEGEEFRIYANYTYTNSSPVLDATCAYTINNISHENYNNSAGNATLCSGGACTYTTRTNTFNSLPTTGFMIDVFRLKLCRNNPSSHAIRLTTDCGSYGFNTSSASIPLCSAGYANITASTKACAGKSIININLTTTAVSLADSIVMVNDFAGIDRFYNDTDYLQYNSTFLTYISNDSHEQYAHGRYEFTVNCTYPEDVENQTATGNYTVVNAPPIPFLDTIWEWFDGEQAFTDGMTVKYPSLGMLNISYLCADDDFKNATLRLVLVDGSLINYYSSTSSQYATVNYTRGNFTRNSARKANLTCTDTYNESRIIEKSFTTEDLLPSFVWASADDYLQPSDIPMNLTFNCSDPEGLNTSSFIFINDTLNATILSPTSVFTFNYSDIGDYNLTGYCTDGVYNSSNDTITIYVRNSCVLNLSSPCPGCRYQDNTILAQAECSNGLNITSCSYSINDYASVSAANCSEFNITAELGRNKFDFTYKSNGIETNVTRYFWAKKMDSDSFSDYSVLVTIAIACALFFFLGFLSRIFWVLSGFGMWFYAYEMIAFSIGFAFLVSVAGGVMMLLALFKRR